MKITPIISILCENSSRTRFFQMENCPIGHLVIYRFELILLLVLQVNLTNISGKSMWSLKKRKLKKKIEETNISGKRMWSLRPAWSGEKSLCLFSPKRRRRRSGRRQKLQKKSSKFLTFGRIDEMSWPALQNVWYKILQYSPWILLLFAWCFQISVKIYCVCKSQLFLVCGVFSEMCKHWLCLDRSDPIRMCFVFWENLHWTEVSFSWLYTAFSIPLLVEKKHIYASHVTFRAIR